MLTAASKSRPVLTSARSSFNAGACVASSRAASTFTASSDIFDAPGRLIFEDELAVDMSRNPSLRYYPSHFRPRTSSQSSEETSPSSSPSRSVSHKPQYNQQPQSNTFISQAPVRHLSTMASHRMTGDASSIIFDGPARPRHPPRVTSRHNHARASSTVAASGKPMPLNPFEGVDMKKYVPPAPLPEPMVFDGPAKPRRKVPVQVKKSSHVSCLVCSIRYGSRD